MPSDMCEATQAIWNHLRSRCVLMVLDDICKEKDALHALDVDTDKNTVLFTSTCDLVLTFESDNEVGHMVVPPTVDDEKTVIALMSTYAATVAVPEADWSHGAGG